MILKPQNLLFLILTVLSLDMYAQNRCQGLFESKSDLRSTEIAESQQTERYKEFLQFMDWFYQEKENLEKTTVDEKSFEKLSLEQKSKIESIQLKIDWFFRPLISSQLKGLHVEFEIKQIKNKTPNSMFDYLEIPIVIITPSSRTGLNRYALGLKKLNAVQLAYSPFQLSRQAGAMYSPQMKTLYLHREALFKKSFVSKSMTPHEIKHALFDAERSHEKTNSVIQYPVHLNFKSKIKSTDLYGSFFSFEELVAYAYSITAVAKDYKMFNTDAESIRYYKTLLAIQKLSIAAKDVVDRALKFVEVSDPFKVQFFADSVEIQINETDTLTLLVPARDKARYSEVDFDYEYVKNELIKARKLAEFNLKYIKDAQSSGSAVTRMTWFRAAQVEFVENLNQDK